MTLNRLFSIICLALLWFPGIAKFTLASEPESRGFPTGEREGGGTRGESRSRCNTSSNPPIALIPENSLGLTASASPTLFFYVPKSEESPELELVLFDENDNIVYQDTLRNSTGIVSLSLPAAFSSDSTVEQLYEWYLICNSGYLPKAIESGSLQRVVLDQNLVNQLEKATPLEKVTLYQEANIWHEPLNILAKSYCDRPQDSAVASKWTELMQSAGLDALSQVTLDSYCSQKREPIGFR